MACKRWTYSGDPANSDSDAVRFMVGDTIRERPLLDDYEVEWIVSQSPNLNRRAALACEALWSRFLAISDYTVGSVSKKFSDVAAKFKERAADFRRDANKNALVSFPAHLVSTKQALENDSELQYPEFSVGMADSPLATQLNDELNDLWRTRGW
jgi:hypothetical protein